MDIFHRGKDKIWFYFSRFLVFFFNNIATWQYVFTVLISSVLIIFFSPTSHVIKLNSCEYVIYYIPQSSLNTSITLEKFKYYDNGFHREQFEKFKKDEPYL